MKILVAIPVYDGKLFCEGVRCLMDEQAFANSVGDELLVRFLPGCSHPAMGRNQLVNDFLESDAERLVFLDADITWELGDLVKIAHSPVDFVGGAYRYKFETENYPVGWLDTPELWANEHGLLEVKALPGGFLSLSKRVFDDFRAFHGERTFEHFGHEMYCYFSMPWNGRMNGEDSFFCYEYQQASGKVYLDPELHLTHWDMSPLPYKGHIGNWLKSR